MSSLKTYLFYIKEESGKEYHLTSINTEIKYNNNIYLPHSGVNLKEASFDDSAQNYILLQGVFEKNGIEKDSKISGAVVKIMSLENDSVEHLYTYICNEYQIKDLFFNIRCEPESIKYNQSLLKMFSKTCRANFCDSKCKLNINDYSRVYDVIEVSANILLCDIKDESIKDNYFQGGKMINSTGEEFTILAHVNNNIEIENHSGVDFSVQKKVTLIPSCDKSFRTCCYSFNNALNFRGEPAIPESNIIKN